MVVVHESIMGGHMGNKKTLDRIQACFYWPGIIGEATQFCQSRDIYQTTVPRDSLRKVPLGKMPIIDEPFKRVAVDIVGSINPESEKGNKYIDSGRLCNPIPGSDADERLQHRECVRSTI